MFISWVKGEGNFVSNLQARLQFGYPGKLEMIALCGGARKDAEELLAQLASSRMGEGNWFSRTPQVVALLDSMIAYYDRQTEETDAQMAALCAPGRREKVSRRSARKDKARPPRASRQRRVNSSRRKVAA